MRRLKMFLISSFLGPLLVALGFFGSIRIVLRMATDLSSLGLQAFLDFLFNQRFAYWEITPPSVAQPFIPDALVFQLLALLTVLGTTLAGALWLYRRDGNLQPATS